MAKLDFNNYQSYSNQTKKESTNKDSKYVRFFSLADDGDEAIVRFPYYSNDQFDLITTHSIKVGDSFKRISCLREPNDSINKCPLCEAGEKVQLRFFCKLVQYVFNDDETISLKPCVWDRPLSLAQQLNDYIRDYGDLSNVVFKIKRQGARGDMKTTYTIYPVNSEMYKSEAFAPDFSAFDNFKLSDFLNRSPRRYVG